MSYYNNDLDVIAGDSHSLLDPPSPAYSNLTVRRAFIVWMYCGQKNKFRDVCGYYHRLEAMEESMSPEDRATSRRHELDLFTNSPPTSSCLRRHFPDLYHDHPVEPYYISKLESIKNEKCIFKLEGFQDYKQSGVTPNEIFEVSKIIRQYCQTHFLSLRKFLDEFQQYAAKCGIKESVANVAAYIKRKQVEAELETVENFPKSFSFLNSSDSTERESVNNEEKPLESQQLKILLGVNGKADNDNLDTKDPSNTCAEFFKLFKHTNLDNKCVSYSNIPPTFEDFAKALDKNMYRSKSVETVAKSVLANKTFKRNQDIFDAHMKISELTKV